MHVEKSPGELKLRRCLSPFVPNLRSSKGSKADSDSLSPSPCSLVCSCRSRDTRRRRRKVYATSRNVSYRASTYFTLVGLGLGLGKFTRCEVHGGYRAAKEVFKRTRFIFDDASAAGAPESVCWQRKQPPGPGKSGWKPPLSLRCELGFLLA